MPRFFTHIRTEARLITDDEGADLDDLNAARRYAVAAAREMLAERVRTGKPMGRDVFEVTAEAGAVVLVMPFAEALVLE